MPKIERMMRFCGIAGVKQIVIHPICEGRYRGNEEAVFAFLEGRIKLFDIIDFVEKILKKHVLVKSPTLDEIFEIDKEVRIKTRELF